jgi:predicted aconitase with swiveling domain
LTRHYRFVLRGLVEGVGEGPLLVRLTPISFYGEVDPSTGTLYGGDSIAGHLLVVPGSRGSTVGPYILYALSKRGLAPSGIVVLKAEPLLVAGAVLAEIPLAEGLPKNALSELASRACHGRLVSRPPRAVFEVTC